MRGSKHAVYRAFLLFAFMLGAFSVQAESGQENDSSLTLSIVLVVIALAVGVQALAWSFRNRYRGKDSFLIYSLRNRIVQLVLASAALIALVSILTPNPWTGDPHQQVKYAQLRRVPPQAAYSYRLLLEDYPFIYEYHYQYVSSYYQKGDWEQPGTLQFEPDPWNSPFPYYQTLLRNWTPGVRDIARLGLGMMDYYGFMRNLAREQLLDIGDTTIPYRNLFLGFIAEEFGELADANRYYRQEFEYGGALDKAVAGLVRLKLTYDRDDLDGIHDMITDPELGPHTPEVFKRYYYMREARLLPYFGSVFSDWWGRAGPIGWTGASLGLLVWIFFLRRIDIFRRPAWEVMIGAVGLGALFCFTALPIYDVLNYELGFDLTGEFSGDFLYCVFGIGVVEELVKLIPLTLIVMLLGKRMRPLDYILYGSLSALGFAFVENIMYMNEGSVSIIHGRVLVAVVFHMFATSTVAFGMVLGRFRYRKYRLPLFIGFFFLAAFMHGIYDFWLLNPAVDGFYFLAYVVFVYATFQYPAYINNCLNNSPIFRGRVVLNTTGLIQYLLIALVGVLLFEYLALSVAYGPRIGNFSLAHSMGMGSFLMFFVVLNLSYIDVVHGEWFVIRFWNFGNRANYNAAIGQQVRLRPAKEGSVLERALPAAGEIIARIRLNKSNQYFLIEFDRPIDLQGVALPYVLVKARGRDEVIEPGHNTEVAVVAFRDRDALMRTHKRRQDFKLLDYAIIC